MTIAIIFIIVAGLAAAIHTIMNGTWSDSASTGRGGRYFIGDSHRHRHTHSHGDNDSGSDFFSGGFFGSDNDWGGNDNDGGGGFSGGGSSGSR
ncbi:MAG: hypothetical protein LBL87_07225 [Ruminococcus sp.]|jgi:hypothetical protein|nr:hypothetical protein [Ruminococcus sp.]